MIEKCSLLLFVAAGLCVSAGPVFAQAERLENGARFGGWTFVCEAIAVNETACALSQRVVRSGPDAALLADFLVVPPAEGEAGWLIARVPIGVHFPTGFSLRPDRADNTDTSDAEDAADPPTGAIFHWQVCSPQLCEAVLDLGSPEGAEILSGNGIALAAYLPSIDADPVVFRVNLSGLTEGMAAMRNAGAAPVRRTD